MILDLNGISLTIYVLSLKHLITLMQLKIEILT